MMHAPKDYSLTVGHPYLYARILAIYHVWALLSASVSSVSNGMDPVTPPQKIKILWV